MTIFLFYGLDIDLHLFLIMIDYVNLRYFYEWLPSSGLHSIWKPYSYH